MPLWLGRRVSSAQVDWDVPRHTLPNHPKLELASNPPDVVRGSIRQWFPSGRLPRLVPPGGGRVPGPRILVGWPRAPGPQASIGASTFVDPSSCWSSSSGLSPKSLFKATNLV